MDMRGNKDIVLVAYASDEENLLLAVESLRNTDWFSDYLSTKNDTLLNCLKINGLLLR
jgi:hypothetical protein